MSSQKDLIDTKQRLSDERSTLLGVHPDEITSGDWHRVSAIDSEIRNIDELLDMHKDDAASSHATDVVESPSHYTYGSIECIDFIDSCGFGFGFCLGNAIKYLCRCEHKGKTLEDMKKARWYLQHAIEKVDDGTYELG